MSDIKQTIEGIGLEGTLGANIEEAGQKLETAKTELQNITKAEHAVQKALGQEISQEQEVTQEQGQER